MGTPGEEGNGYGMSSESTYAKIAADLRDAIAAGSFRPGDRLPTEADLMAQYGVARGTVRQALGRLRQEGVITVERGSGARVRRIPPVRRMSSDRFARSRRESGRGAYDVEMREAGYIGRTTFVELGPAPCPEDVAELLGLAPGSQVMKRARLMYAAPMDATGRADYSAEEVMQAATSYVPWAIAEGTAITQEDSGAGGIYSRIEEAGHPIARFRERLRVGLATDEQCDALGLEAPALVLRLDRTAYDNAGSAVEVCQHVLPPTLYDFEYEFAAM